MVLICISPWWLMILFPFPCACWPSVLTSLEKSLFFLAYFLLLLFLLLLSCMSYFYILEINPIGHIICKYFPLSRLSFCIVDGFLCCMKAFKFSYVFVYVCFYFSCFRRQIEKILAEFISNNILPMFYSSEFYAFWSCYLWDH